MKAMKIVVCALVLLFAVLAITGCQKEIAGSETATGNNKIANKVNDWLNQLGYSAGSQWSSRVQLVKENLVYVDAWTEKLPDDELLIITPINENTSSSFNKERMLKHYLVLIQDRAGKIRKGDVVQFSTTDKRGKQMPAGLLHDYFNHIKTDRDFMLTFLTVFDRPLYEINCQDGSIKQYSQAERKEKPGFTGKTAENCLEYYWNTYVDGVLVSSVYLGTICSPEVEEGAGGGGAGGGVPEAETVKYVSYVAYEENGYNCHPEIHSRVEFKGQKVSGEPQGGHFTNIRHYDSWTEDFVYPMDWHNIYWSAWTGSQDAREALQCNIFYGVSIPERYINPVKLFMFNDVFP